MSGPDTLGSPPDAPQTPEAQAEERLGRADAPEVITEVVRGCGSGDELMAVNGDAGRFVAAFDEAVLKVASRREQEERAKLVADGGKVLRRELRFREGEPRPKPKAPPPPSPREQQERLLEQARQSGGTVEAVAAILQKMTREGRGKT